MTKLFSTWLSSREKYSVNELLIPGNNSSLSSDNVVEDPYVDELLQMLMFELLYMLKYGLEAVLVPLPGLIMKM